tara:strand:- start:7515 stop:7742 length:228 start_codon:yes stop_codon:yes gene_type:complete
MTQKGKRGKPTRKDIDNAFKIIGQKLQYLEQYTVANERVFDLFLEFVGKKDKFINFLEKEATKNKEDKKVEKTDK